MRFSQILANFCPFCANSLKNSEFKFKVEIASFDAAETYGVVDLDITGESGTFII